MDWTNRRDILTAILMAIAVLVGTGILRMITQDNFSPNWFWTGASGLITWVTPKLRRRLDAQDRRPEADAADN